MDEKTIRVVVGDDDASFREALLDVLHADARFLVTGSATTSDELVELVGTVDADVALVDVRMPGGGVSAAARLSAPDAPWAPLVVVAVSADTAVGSVLGMIRAGATGYLAKGRLGASLPDLVSRCAQGEAVFAVPGSAEALRTLAAAHETRISHA